LSVCAMADDAASVEIVPSKTAQIPRFIDRPRMLARVFVPGLDARMPWVAGLLRDGTTLPGLRCSIR
jgi:hypothetical protein